MDIQKLHEAPFRSLPVNNGNLFDLTAEFLRAKLIASAANYQQIVSLAFAITSDTLAFHQDDQLFNTIDSFINDYAQVIRCVKLSLGVPIPPMNNPTQVFKDFGYQVNQPLHINVAGLRNTAAHFEERLQEYGQQAEPFLQISYKGSNYQWQSRFGVGGYSKSGSGVAKNEKFDEEKLIFHSYKVDGPKSNKTIVNVDIPLYEILQDLEEIIRLLGNNIDDAIAKKGAWCPPVRNITAVLSADEGEISGL